MKTKLLVIEYVLFLILLSDFSCVAQSVALPKSLEQVRIDQKLNNQIPLDLEFRDENNRRIKLQQYFGKRPVILTFVYFKCPMLCSYVMRGLSGSLKAVPLEMGKDFEMVTVSFEPKDTPEFALSNKTEYAKLYGRKGSENGWHFLTGQIDSIKRLTQATGFSYNTVPEAGQYAHAAAIMVLTPDGKLARYFYGIEYPPKDLRLALVEASKNKIGSFTDQILTFCFHYDPQTGKYSLAIIRILQAGGVVTLTALLCFMFFHIRKDRKHA